MSGYLPISQASTMPNYDNSAVELLTPSTFLSLEQAFSNYGEPGRNESNYLSSTQYLPTVIEPTIPAGPVMAIKHEYSDDYSSEDSEASSSWTPAKQSRVSDADSSTSSAHFSGLTNTGHKGRPTGPRRRGNDAYLPPEEAVKKQQRRERNKQAAARCRQRRVDLTNKLEAECRVLEEEKRKLEKTIADVRQQKDHLEYILEAHKPLCGTSAKSSMVSTTVVVKPESSSVVVSMAKPSGQYQVGHVKPTAVSTTLPRPSTLVLAKPRGVGDEAGATSSEFFSTMGLDIMLEGHTGLTPLTSMATPIGGMATTGMMTCTNQQYQRTASSSSGESTSALMAL